ncbi:MAG: Maf family protein [Lachnospira sp.]|nr:Maf family protein [Lachnospira sp.]
MMRIILASASPRRKELLEQVGIKFEIITSQASEDIELMPPYDYVKELSRRKARAVFDMLKERGEDLSDCVIIGADTVVYHKGEILTKPKDKEDARRMIKGLSDNAHQVYTGVCLIKTSGVGDKVEAKEISFSEKTEVLVYPLTDESVEAYISTKEPYDKAGAYGIQGLFAAYIKAIEGDYNNVVGLPVARICLELYKLGYRIEYERC